MGEPVKAKPVKLKKARAPKSEDIVRSISDDCGNLVICRNNGKRIKLSLKLVSEDRYRRIGTVNLAQKSFECKRVREKHLYRLRSAYAFNSKLLHEAKLFDTIRLIDNYDRWTIPLKYILENGFYLNFKGSGGFETQLFIELEKIEQFKKSLII